MLTGAAGAGGHAPHQMRVRATAARAGIEQTKLPFQVVGMLAGEGRIRGIAWRCLGSMAAATARVATAVALGHRAAAGEQARIDGHVD